MHNLILHQVRTPVQKQSLLSTDKQETSCYAVPQPCDGSGLPRSSNYSQAPKEGKVYSCQNLTVALFVLGTNITQN